MATFTNQATLFYNGGSVLSNITTGEIVERLSVEKNAAGDTYAAGDTVTYTVSLVNSGDNSLGRLTLVDNLGAYMPEGGTAPVVPLRYVEGSLLYFVDGVLQAPPDIAETRPLTIPGLRVPANGSAMLVYVAEVTEFAPLEEGGTIVNTAVVRGGGLRCPVMDTETITAAGGAALSISKELFPATVTENGVLTYTFSVFNSGNTPVEEDGNAVITDVFDPTLSNITVTYNGETWEAGEQYNYNPVTGVFSTIGGNLPVAAAQFVRDPETGAIRVVPGTGTLVVTGTISSDCDCD